MFDFGYPSTPVVIPRPRGGTRDP